MPQTKQERPGYPVDPGRTVTATDAQNKFGEMMRRAERGEAVVITKHDEPRAVLLSVEEYEALTGVEERILDSLGVEFDALFDRMQTAEAREAMDRAFRATPEELGEGAVRRAGKEEKHGDG